MFATIVLVSWLSGAGSAAAANEQEESLEYTVKAAYLTKFGGFVEWPAGAFAAPNAPFVIGVLGDDPFGVALDQIAGTQTVHGRPINLRRFSRPEQVSGVHVLYISPSERDRLPALAASLNARGILTVADAGMPGVIVNFVIDNNRVRFDIDLDLAERVGLKISSKLLSVAKSVKSTRS